jgi:hypothetical protein
MSTSENSALIAKVEDFLERLHNDEIEIATEATKKTFDIPKVGGAEKRTLSDLLSEALVKYENSRLDKWLDESERISITKVLYHWISVVESNGLIRSSEKFRAKVRKAEKEKVEIEQELRRYEKLYKDSENRCQQLEAKYDELVHRIKTIYDHCPRCGFSWSGVKKKAGEEEHPSDDEDEAGILLEDE